MPAINKSSHGSLRRTINEINMVPFIDVMLVLLIIFMVTAPMIAPSVVNLPAVGQADRSPDKVIQVIIQKDDQMTVKSGANSSSVTIADVGALVKSYETQSAPSNEATAVVISADKHIEYDKVIQVMNALQKAGVKRLGLSVQLEH